MSELCILTTAFSIQSYIFHSLFAESSDLKLAKLFLPSFCIQNLRAKALVWSFRKRFGDFISYTSRVHKFGDLVFKDNLIFLGRGRPKWENPTAFSLICWTVAPSSRAVWTLWPGFGDTLYVTRIRCTPRILDSPWELRSHGAVCSVLKCFAVAMILTQGWGRLEMT